MKVVFTSKFSKDLYTIKEKDLVTAIKDTIIALEKATLLNEVAGLKKLKGYKTAYRIRIGDYRLGFYFENGTAIIARVIHRKEMYRFFP